MVRIVWVTIIFGLFLTCPVGGQTCPQEVSDEIQRCVTPVAQFAETLGVDVKESGLGADRLMPSMGSEVFRQLCSKISTFSTCVRKAKRICPNHITLTLINASYGYLCTDGFNVFVTNADCLMKLDQDESVRVCHDRTMGAIKNSSTDTKSPMSLKLTKMCDSLNYFATCVERPVLRECGSPAWSVIARVLHDTTKTLMPSCKFAVPLPEQSPTEIGQKASAQQQVNTSKAVGRQKILSGKENKNKGRHGGGRQSLTEPVGGAGVNGGVLWTVIVSVLVVYWNRLISGVQQI